MQIRKIYKDVNPELLYDEVKDFIIKQGVVISESKLETYLLPDNTSSFTYRGTLASNVPEGQASGERECLRAHVVGTVKGETKLTLDIKDKLFPQEKVSALLDDLEFIFGVNEARDDDEED